MGKHLVYVIPGTPYCLKINTESDKLVSLKGILKMVSFVLFKMVS